MITALALMACTSTPHIDSGDTTTTVATGWYDTYSLRLLIADDYPDPGFHYDAGWPNREFRSVDATVTEFTRDYLVNGEVDGVFIGLLDDGGHSWEIEFALTDLKSEALTDRPRLTVGQGIRVEFVYWLYNFSQGKAIALFDKEEMLFVASSGDGFYEYQSGTLPLTVELTDDGTEVPESWGIAAYTDLRFAADDTVQVSAGSFGEIAVGGQPWSVVNANTGTVKDQTWIDGSSFWSHWAAWPKDVR